MTVKELLKGAAIKLAEENVIDPQISAEVLLAEVLNVTRTELFANPEKELTPDEVERFRLFISRRAQNEPVQQIIGKVKFWGLDFRVDNNVLVPRPETEFLVKKIIEFAKKEYKGAEGELRVLDMGTGSGPIVCALAYEFTHLDLRAQFFASDVSGKALSVAKENADFLGLAQKIKFEKGSLFSPWKGQKFDIIAANLPYIPHEDMEGLALDVFHFEPRTALDGGKLGLDIYDEFLASLSNHLRQGGICVCEIGINQGPDYIKLARKYLPKARVAVEGDLAGIDRLATILF